MPPHPVPVRPATTPVAQGRVLGVHDDSQLARAPALTVGSVASHSSSLTRAAPSASPPEGSLSSSHPEFLRKRVTPSRHDVPAEELDKELLLNASDIRTHRYDSTGLSSEIREFPKL